MSDKDKSIDRTLDQEMNAYEKYKTGRELFDSFQPALNLLILSALPMVEDFVEAVSRDSWGKKRCKRRINKLTLEEYQACLISKRKESALAHYDINENKYLDLFTREILEDDYLYNLTEGQEPRDFRVKFLHEIIEHNDITCPAIWKLRKIIQYV